MMSRPAWFGKPLPMRLKLLIRERTAAGDKIKPLARELGLNKNTVKKYRARP